MSEPFSPVPEWVHKRDGRLVPFESDKISRALFAATERLGRPDPFTARELTDGVLHFLAVEADHGVPTTAQVAELVVKVVRELGQPALAQAFAAGEQDKHTRNKQAATKVAEGEDWSSGESSCALVRRAGAEQARVYALREVFARDLAAAHHEGLLVLGGLETPGELSGWLAGPPENLHLVEVLEQARDTAGQFLAVDGPEYLLAQHSATARVADYVRELGIGLRATGLRAVVNLHCATPPSWAGELAEGPLFAGQRHAVPSEVLSRLADELLELLLQSTSEGIRIDWHVGERDLIAAETGRLTRLARSALEGGLAFTFDRPRRPVCLAEGVDRQHPAVLLTVGLCLPRLAQHLSGNSAALLLRKLGSLARLALSAGVQKREFLRRRQRAWPAFLLERARLVVVPLGLEAVVRSQLGTGLCAGEAGLELARNIVRTLAEVLARDGRAVRLETCVDATPFLGGADAAGVTPWDATVPLKSQLKAAGLLHASQSAGTVVLCVPEETQPSVDEVVDLVRWTWRHTDIVRLRFVRSAVTHLQQTAW